MILVDTHVVVWLAFDQDQISRKARIAIDEARKNADGLAVCDITLLELATLATLGRIRLDISVESFPRKSDLGSLFCQSVAGHAPAPWDFQRLIPKIQQIALSGLLRWSRGYPCLPLILRSAGRKRCRRFGKNSDTGVIRRASRCREGFQALRHGL